MQGIYKIQNKINDNQYVGSTNDFEDRWVEHRSTLRRGVHFNPYLQRAWNKYGENSFVFGVIEEVKGDNRALLKREQAYLNKGFVLGNLYNIAKDASAPMRGKSHTKKSRDKMSKSQAGSHCTQETKDKISAALMGHEVTQETRDKMRVSKQGENNVNYGRRLGQKIRDKMSIAQRKRFAVHQNPFKGKNHTEEAKKAIADASAKSYPAFFNIRTGKYIPAGHNLSQMCREHNLSNESMRSLGKGHIKRNRDGWRLVG